MEDLSLFERLKRKVRAKFFAREVTIYPTYGYRDPSGLDTWVVPIRIWVHDDPDTPFVEKAFERVVVRYFERDLGRSLEQSEIARLEKTLEHFIADDKSDYNVELTFPDDPKSIAFRLEKKTSRNGVIEENLRLPDEFVQGLYAHREASDRWVRIHARTSNGTGNGEGLIRFLKPTGLCVVSDIDDTLKITQVPAGKRTVLRNTFLKDYKVAEGMRERYLGYMAEAGPDVDVCFHYISGAPWQMYGLLRSFLLDQEGFPQGTFHMKNLRKNLFEGGALRSIRDFALGGDLATLDQKVRQITNLIMHLPQRKFILVGDSGEKDPEVYRAIQHLFPDQIQKIVIRNVLGGRLAGMELIEGPDVPVFLDTSELIKEMEAQVAQARREAPGSTLL